MGKLPVEQKRNYAELLYCEHQLLQKIVAQKVGISEQTMSAWVKKYKWDQKRRPMLISKDNQLRHWYDQLEELNQAIKKKPEGARYANSKEADTFIKISASIKNLETELNIGDKIQALMDFVKYMQKNFTAKEAVTVTDYADEYIKSLL